MVNARARVRFRVRAGTKARASVREAGKNRGS